MSILAQRYAKAMFQVAQDQGVVDPVAEDLAGLAEILQVPEIRHSILDPDTHGDVRRRVLDKVLAGAQDLTKNTMGVVLKRRRESILPDLSDAFQVLSRAARGVVLGLVETAKPLDTEGLAAVEKRATQLAGRAVTLESKVNPELIGGIRIRVGNTLFDDSVATALQELERRMMESTI